MNEAQMVGRSIEGRTDPYAKQRAMLNIASSCPSPERTPLLKLALNELGVAVAELDELVNQLDQRLQPILLPGGPACDSGNKEITHGVPVVDEIAVRHRHIQRMSNALRDIRNRLEV